MLLHGQRWLYVPYYQKHWPINGIQTARTQIRNVVCHVDLHTPVSFLCKYGMGDNTDTTQVVWCLLYDRPLRVLIIMLWYGKCRRDRKTGPRTTHHPSPHLTRLAPGVSGILKTTPFSFMRPSKKPVLILIILLLFITFGNLPFVY